MLTKSKYLFLLAALLISALVEGQDVKYQYSIKPISGDSFYLVERALKGDRDTSVKYTAMKDTTEIKEALRLLKREQKRAERDWKALRKEADSLQSRYDQLRQVAIDALNISGFGGGGNNRSATPTNGEQFSIGAPGGIVTVEKPAGYWVITSPSKATFILDLKTLKSTALVLNPDGTTTKYVPPKSTKPKQPPK